MPIALDTNPVRASIARLVATCSLLQAALTSSRHLSEDLQDDSRSMVNFVFTYPPDALLGLLAGANKTVDEVIAIAERLLASVEAERDQALAAMAPEGGYEINSSSGVRAVQPVLSSGATAPRFPDGQPEEGVFEPPEQRIAPSFPWDYWEPWEQDLCNQLGDSLGIAPTGPAVHGLAVKAAGSQATCTVSGHNQFPVFTSIFLLEAGRTTTSKTALRTVLDRPLLDCDRELRRSARARQAEMFARAQLARRDALAATQRVQRLPASDREGSISELTDSWDLVRAARRGSETTPRMTTSNATWPTLKMMLGQTGRLYLSSGEGRAALRLIPNSEELCDVYSHSRLDDDRTTRRGVSVESPALTISLAMQLGVLSDVLRNRDYAEVGVLGRFLYHQAESGEIGRTLVESALTNRFYERIRMLVQQPVQPDRLDSSVKFILEGGSLERYYRCRDDGYRQEAEGDLQGTTGWGRRMGENMLRLSGVLHAWRHPDLANAPRVIAEETVDASVRLMEYFAWHAREVFRASRVSPGTLAQQVLEWIAGQPRAVSASVFRFRDMMSSRFNTHDRSDLLPALNQLVTDGWLEELPVVNHSQRFRILRAPTRRRT